MRKLVLWACVGLAGAGTAILPSLGSAQATTASFTALDNGTFFSVPTWSANGTSANTVTITPGGTVSFSYPAGTSVHNVVFTGAQPSSCTQDTAPYGYSITAAPPLPYTPEPPAWSGSCRFDAAGTYPFQDGKGGPAMSGTVTVAVPTTTPPPATTTQTTTQTTTGMTTETFHEPPIPAASSSLRAAAVQHGTTVRGQVHVTAPDSRIVADLLIGRTRLGRTTLRGVSDGTRHFKVSLYASARKRLGRSRRLTVTLSVQVLSIGLGPTVLRRHVLLVG